MIHTESAWTSLFRLLYTWKTFNRHIIPWYIRLQRNIRRKNFTFYVLYMWNWEVVCPRAYISLYLYVNADWSLLWICSYIRYYVAMRLRGVNLWNLCVKCIDRWNSYILLGHSNVKNSLDSYWFTHIEKLFRVGIQVNFTVYHNVT